MLLCRGEDSKENISINLDIAELWGTTYSDPWLKQYFQVWRFLYSTGELNKNPVI